MLAGLLLAPARSHAQRARPPRGGSAQQGGGASTPQSPRIMDDIARRHFELGNEYFQVSRYDDAAREFQQAYEVSHQPELLYNMASALEAAGNIRGALEAYQRYDDAGAPGFSRDVLHARMDTLRERLAASQAAAAASRGTTSSAATTAATTGEPPRGNAPDATPSDARTRPAPSPPAHQAPLPPRPRVRVEYRQPVGHTVGPAVMLGLGGASGIAGVVFAVMAGTGIDTINRINSGGVPWNPRYEDVVPTAQRDATIAMVAGAAGGALLIGGALWLALRGPGERREVPLRAMVVPGGAAVGAGGAF